MKISFGLIVQNFSCARTIIHFFKNSQKFGHNIYSFVIAYSGNFDDSVFAELSSYAKVFPVKINRHTHAEQYFNSIGVSEKSTNTLLTCKEYQDYGLVPYGHNRNTVIIESYLTESDVLLFVDYDVFPKVLKRDNSQLQLQEIDFVGQHLEYLQRDSIITTSDYSGYNILPPASFPNMDNLLVAFQKENMIPFWSDSLNSHNLFVQQDSISLPKQTKKILGGNMGINLHKFMKTLPFFSSSYIVSDSLYLARGEDTLIGSALSDIGLTCTDIDLHIFHNTYNTWMDAPSLKDNINVQKRFFYACTGWLGRNPLMNWLQNNNLNEVKEKQRYNLSKGVASLVKYTSNDIYKILPNALEASWNNLPYTIHKYTLTVKAWKEFVQRSNQYENTFNKSFPTRRIREWNIHH